MADFLTLQDLYNCVPPSTLLKYFDDDGDGAISATDPPVVAALASAESTYYSRMLRSLSRPNALALAANDDAIRKHVAWVACEIASERRVEFTNAEGRGAHWAQYERALKEIDLLSKSSVHSIGELQSGPLANSGGQVTAPADSPPFAVAPTRRSQFGGSGPNGGQGGF